MLKCVYIETTVISYLAALPSRDLVKAARQDVSWQWWNTRRSDFNIYVSETVIEEITRGDVKRRLAVWV